MKRITKGYGDHQTWPEYISVCDPRYDDRMEERETYKEEDEECDSPLNGSTQEKE